ncbi:MAG: methylated-DNA--[protein]-cysteine S-methyltransferase, partial [Anaerolineales bacterium]
MKLGNRPALDPVVAAWLGDAPDRAADRLTTTLDRLYGAGPGEKAQANARARLSGALAREDVGRRAPAGESLRYARLGTSPLGPVFVAFSRQGLVALDFGVSERKFLDHLLHETGLAARLDDRGARRALDQIREYLQGKRRRFALPLDLSARTPFQRRVLEATLEVPAGRVATYLEIARRIGRPAAARAVGRALATNPIPLVIP